MDCPLPAFISAFVRRRIVRPAFVGGLLLLSLATSAFAQIVTQPPAAISGTATGSVTISASAPAASAFQWEKSTDGGSTYTAISGNASATTASLTLTNLQASDAGHYRVVTTPAETSTACVLKVLPRTVVAANGAIRAASQSGAPAVTGAGAVGTTGSVWNNLMQAAPSTTDLSQNLISNAALISDSGTVTDMKVTMNSASATQPVSAQHHAWSNNSNFAPVSAIMDYYTYYWWDATLTLTFTGLAPGRSYDLYGFGTGDGAGQGSKWSFAPVNGGATMSAMADFGSGFTRDVTNPANLGHAYVKITGAATSGGTLTVTVDNATGQNDPFLNGFQLVPVASTAITGQPANALATVGGSASFTVTAPAAVSFQWQSSNDGGTTFDTIDPIATPSATTATLTLTNVQTTSPSLYRVLVTDGGGAVSYSSNASLVVLTTANTTPTPQVNLAFRSPTRGGITVTGAAAIGSSGSVWNNLTGAALSTTLQSQDLLSNAALVSDSGAATGVALTLNAASPTQTINNVVKAWNNGTNFPTVTPIMDYWTYYWWNGTVTLTLTGLRPGASYELYGYGAGDSHNTGSSWTMAPANGGATANCLGDYNNGYSRDVTNPANLGHSYVKLTGTATSTGTLTVVVDNAPGQNDPHFNGFQIQEAAQTTITSQPANTVTTAGAGATISVAAPTAQSYLWQRSTDGGSTWTTIDPATNASSATSSLVLTNSQSGDAGLYRVIVLNAQGGVIISQTAALSVVPNGGSTPDTAFNVAFRASNQSGAPAVTGAAAVGSAGSVWNNIIGAAAAGTPTQALVSNAALVDDAGAATGKTMSLSVTAGSYSVSDALKTGNDSTSFSPSAIMRYYTYYWWNTALTVTINGLTAGRSYDLYGYGAGNNNGQGSKWILDAANGGGSAEAPADYSNGYTRDVTDPANLNHSYVKLSGTASPSGTLTFVVDNATGQNDPFFNGFQVVPQAMPTITAQPPANATATLTGSFSVGVTASGPGTLSYQWQKSTDGGATFANISAAANPSAATATLSIAVVQASDAGTYRVLVSNASGTVVSSNCAVTTSEGLVAPTIQTHPVSTTVLAGATATFTVGASGTSPLTYQWQRSADDGANYSNVGTNSSTLNITGTVVADAGLYRVVITNSVGTLTSNAATLTVNQAPTILTQPVGQIVASGSPFTLTVSASGSPAPTHQWQMSTDGVTFTNVSGATAATLPLTVTAATSGYYRVIATNLVGSVTSSVVYLGAATTQSITFAPGNNATGISIDQQLRLSFPSAPKLGIAGTLTVRDAADNSVVSTINLATLSKITFYAATIPNLAVRNVQGTNFNYMPIAVYGNEVWITLSQRLAYGRTYYVTMDPAVVLDSTNAAFPGVSDPNTWRFSTKVSGPATPTPTTGPTTITVGLDGTGDFATLQGASDWIPQNNTLPRTIRIKPGIYFDCTTFAQNRHFVTMVGDGATRHDVQLVFPYAAFSSNNFPAGTLRVESSDVTVRDLTVDNIIYTAYTPTGTSAYGSNAFTGPINTVATTGSRIVFDNVLIKGGQDTLYTVMGITYFYGCEVWGSVDFIYGAALSVFDNSDIVEIRNTGGPIGAPNTSIAQPHGLVFLNCRFPRALVANGYPYDVNANSTTFERPWGNDGTTAVINCALGTHISTKGWGEWSGRENTCRAREYGSTLIGGGTAATVAQRQTAGAYWLNTIDPDYTSPAMSPTDALLVHPTGSANRVPVTVNPADYTLAAIFGNAYYNLNGWLPSVPTRITTQPISQTVNRSQSVTFSVSATSPFPLSYQWYRDNEAISGATGSSFTLPSAAVTDWGSYSVVIASSAGTVTSSSATLIINDPVALWADANGLNPATTGLSTADPDSDGLTNLLEFAFGMNPSSSSIGTFAISGNTLTQTGLPSVNMGTTITARFIRRKTHATDGLIYTPQFSANLTTWENSATTPTVIASDTTHDVVELPFPPPSKASQHASSASPSPRPRERKATGAPQLRRAHPRAVAKTFAGPEVEHVCPVVKVRRVARHHQPHRRR
ncbi:MAG: immunoglobulin domain-containing protein [Verrucomicrobiaceae bacterium]|nr:immunoglobulin domain-containing protein [Verrucomicrobiaceae bacterium]